MPRTNLVLLCLALLLGSATLVPCAALSTPSTHDQPDFHAVAPGISRGGAPTVAGLQRPRALGVHTVIDLRISPRQARREKAEAQRLGFTWINLPMGSDPPTERQGSTLLSTLGRAPQEPVRGGGNSPRPSADGIGL